MLLLKYFQHKVGTSDPQTHYLFPFCHALWLWQIMKYKKNSVSMDKTKKVRLLHEVSVAKVILQARDIVRGKRPTIIPSFFTATT